MPLVFPQADFATYLNNPAAAADARATLILGMAEALCETIVSPLPVSPAVEAVVFDVAERAYANPTPSGDSGVALYQEAVGPFADTNAGTRGGLYLTGSNIATLRQVAGRGGAFTIDTLPVGYQAPAQPWWDSGAGWSSDTWDTPS